MIFGGLRRGNFLRVSNLENYNQMAMKGSRKTTRSVADDGHSKKVNRSAINTAMAVEKQKKWHAKNGVSGICSFFKSLAYELCVGLGTDILSAL